MGELILNDNRYLGALCYRNHNHKDSGLSVRYKKKGRKKGGICVACNQEYHKAADKKRVKDEARRVKENTVTAICPMSEWWHNVTIEGGWIGNGMPRKYCPTCLEKKNRWVRGEVNYGYCN